MFTLKSQTSNLKSKIALALLLCVSQAVQANPITKAEARLVAQSLVGINDTSDDNVPVAPYYIFSRGAGQGFVIASGDDNTAPILGYTEQGDFDFDALPPQLQSMLSLWKERIGEVQLRPQVAGRRLSAPRRAIADYKKEWTNVTPLLKTHWHQSTPYNNLAPIKEGVGRCMTGCVATAGSQVTYYFRKDNPTELAYNTPTYGYGTPVTVSLPKGTPIEWNLMKLSGTGSAKQDSAVAKLMYALGTSAWLTYGDGDGLATSGHNDKMAEAMKGQFRLNYSYKSKSEYSQQKWEELIYQNLTSKRPMLYSGVHPDNGGHSVCLDGYQASTGLYHFNFGWGGQGDGYYTVDDATGMNGFNSYQDLVFNITPQVQNLEGTLTAEPLFQNAGSTVVATVTNNGTLDYQGIYLYVNAKRAATGTAAASDTETNIEPGKSVTLSFTVNTSLADSACVVLCDKNRRILASQMVDVVPTVADLHLNAIGVDGSAEATTVDDMMFHHVNNTTATVTATLTNDRGGSFCQPKLTCFLQRYLTSTKKWMNVKNISVDEQTFESGQTCSVDFVFTNLAANGYFRAYISNKAVATTETDITMDTADTCVCFTVRKPDLNIAVDGRTATVTGHWNAKLFTQMATDAAVTSYDVSGLAELNEKPVTANPNAIFYTTEEWLTANGQLSEPGGQCSIENVVVGDVCQRLTIRTGADFKPLKPFTAKEASLVLTDAAPGKWHGALLPFPAEMPYGMQVKKATEYVTTGLATVNHEATRSVEAMSVVTYLTSRTGLNTITANNVAITTDTVATFFDGIMQASTLAMELQPNSLVPGEYVGSLYFIAPPAGQTVADAFLPVIVGASAQRVRTTSETLVDGYYRSLSLTIDEAYSAIGEYPRASAKAVDALKAEITAAQDMLTYRSHQDNEDVKNQREALTAAIKTFCEAAENETAVTGDVNGDGNVDVADIAAVIDIMAGAALPDGSPSGTADVNGDGNVDVADIAAIIDIMAGVLTPHFSPLTPL